MQFRIADTFTDSLARLTGDEQKAVKTAAFDLQMNPAHPGLKLHQVDRAKDKNFWSVRVSRDIRLIVHRTASSFLLCYVVEREYNGPARVSGSAGTGKTIVALHRAVHLARANPESRAYVTDEQCSQAGCIAARMQRGLSPRAAKHGALSPPPIFAAVRGVAP